MNDRRLTWNQRQFRALPLPANESQRDSVSNCERGNDLGGAPIVLSTAPSETELWDFESKAGSKCGKGLTLPYNNSSGRT